ncbi:MAG: hypothetical protein QXL94_00135 [Candidatus Parvarchaeum sp.]
MKPQVMNSLNEVILSLSNFIQDGRVIASPDEIEECMSILMDIRFELLGVEQAKQRRTKKYLN